MRRLRVRDRYAASLRGLRCSDTLLTQLCGAGTIYFKDLLPQDGNRLGRWEGAGNALYMMCPSVGVNLAVGRPAKSSSVWSDETDPSKACDGDESRDYPNIFHSAGPEQEAWWSVELERPTPHPTVRLL